MSPHGRTNSDLVACGRTKAEKEQARTATDPNETFRLWRVVLLVSRTREETHVAMLPGLGYRVWQNPSLHLSSGTSAPLSSALTFEIRLD